MAQETILKEGKLRGSKILYPDGMTGVNIWYPFCELVPDSGETDDAFGINFEIDLRDLDDALKLLSRLRDAEANKLEELTSEEDN